MSTDAIKSALAVLAGVVTLVLAGCGGSEKATMYVLFDSSQSSSQLIREGHRDGAILLAKTFCRRHHDAGEILFNVITGTPEADSLLTSVQCPHRKNETDFRAKLLAFESQIAPIIDDYLQRQALVEGSDIGGAIGYAAQQAFTRFPAKYQYLIVFSDMQQSAGGVHRCLLKRSVQRAAICASRYERASVDMRRGELADVAVFASGVGETVGGHLRERDRRAYKAFWQAFFRDQRARVCWFERGNLPVVIHDDGTRTVSDKYFAYDCPPVM